MPNNHSGQTSSSFNPYKVNGRSILNLNNADQKLGLLIESGRVSVSTELSNILKKLSDTIKDMHDEVCALKQTQECTQKKLNDQNEILDLIKNIHQRQTKLDDVNEILDLIKNIHQRQTKLEETINTQNSTIENLYTLTKKEFVDMVNKNVHNKMTNVMGSVDLRPNLNQNFMNSMRFGSVPSPLIPIPTDSTDSNVIPPIPMSCLNSTSSFTDCINSKPKNTVKKKSSVFKIQKKTNKIQTGLRYRCKSQNKEGERLGLMTDFLRQFPNGSKENYWDNIKIKETRFCIYCLYYNRHHDQHNQQFCTFNPSIRELTMKHPCKRCGILRLSSRTKCNEKDKECIEQASIMRLLSEKFPVCLQSMGYNLEKKEFI